MGTAAPCPEVHRLKRYLRAELSDDESSVLEEHLSSCEECAMSIHGLFASDPIADALGALSARQEESVSKFLSDLIEKLSARGPAFAEPQTSPETTLKEGVSHDQESGPGDSTREIFEFLRPGEGEDEIGRLGPYRILKPIGSGGMGVVFLAEDPHLKRLVALKVMKYSRTANEIARKRFLREAQAVAALEHDHVVAIFQAGEDAGVLYLAMPLLKGEPLDARLKRERRLPVADALRIAREIAEGLTEAHGKGLVHRDIKPANLWLEAGRDRVKILDFGLARAMEDDGALTQTGVIAGTPQYMSPEQARGTTITPKCDLFSLGCVLYHTLVGRPPFRGKDTVSTLLAVSSAVPDSPRAIDPQLMPAVSDLVMRLLAKEPGNRPASAGDVASEIAVIERNLSAPPAVKRDRRPVVAMGFAAAALVALAAVVVSLKTDRGTLVLTLNEPDVKLLVDGEPARYTIASPRDTIEVRLPSGEHLLEVTKDGFTTYTDRFKVVRGGREELSAKLQPMEPAAPKAIAPSKAESKPPATTVGAVLADRAKPFVMVGADGKVREEHKYAGSALAVVQAGDTVLVHGNGPFRLPSLHLNGKSFTLRAAPGYRPRLVKDDPVDDTTATTWVESSGATLQVEGCDFVDNSLGAAFMGGGGAWSFRNCRILKRGGIHVQYFGGPRVSVEDCLIFDLSGSGQATFLLAHTATDTELVLRNNVILKNGGMLLNLACDGQVVRLLRNTIVIRDPFEAGTLFHALQAKGEQPIRIEAVENVLAIDELLFHAGKTWQDLQKRVVWSGRDNLYVGIRHWFHGDIEEEETNPKARPAAGLAAWKTFWNTEELRSREVPESIFATTRLVRSDPDTVIRALRADVERLRGRPGFEELGPDWDLVGPGDAYVRALNARGERIPDDRLRPEADEKGPFTIIRAGKVVDSQPTLRQAVDWAQSDDVVEIRGDGPFEIFGFLPGVIKTLTIRAAPGYRPILEGKLFYYPGRSFAFEGIRFRNSAIITTFDSAFLGGRLTRLMNCSFEGRHPELASSGLVTSGSAADDHAPLLVENCLIVGEDLSDTVRLGMTGTRSLVVRNSAVGMLWLEGKGNVERHVELDRCVVWAQTVGRQPLLRFGEASSGRLAFAASRTLFDCRTGLWFDAHDPAQPMSWEGSRNVYRIPQVKWLANLSRTESLVVSLAAWTRTAGVKEDHSIEAEPYLYSPSSWRLQPGSAGYQDGPKGQDLGADIDRVARPTVAEPKRSAVTTAAPGS